MFLLRVVLLAVVVGQVCYAAYFATGASERLVDAARSEFLREVDAVYHPDTAQEVESDKKFSLHGIIRRTSDANITSHDPANHNYAAVGFAANQCIVGSTYSFKFQMDGDSCTQAYVQFFKGSECVTRHYTVPLLKASPNERHLECTTNTTALSDTKPVAITAFYADVERAGPVVQYATFPLSTCIVTGTNSLKYICRGYPIIETFKDSNCTGEAVNAEYPPAKYTVPLLSGNNTAEAARTGTELYASVYCRT